MSYAGVKPLTSFMGAVGIKSLGEDHLRQFVPKGARHGPGGLLASLVAMLAAGGEHLSDLDMPRTNPGLFGKVASNATTSRFFEPIAEIPEAFTGSSVFRVP